MEPDPKTGFILIQVSIQHPIRARVNSTIAHIMRYPEVSITDVSPSLDSARGR